MLMKRYVNLIAIALFLWIMLIDKPSIHAEMSSNKLRKDDKQSCEQMSSTQKDNWETIMHFLKPDNVDIEEMKNHLNQEILTSHEQLQAELDLKDFINCPDIEKNDYDLPKKMATYYELLAYIDQIMDKESSLEIEDLTFKNFHNDIFMKYIEASFHDGKTVEVQYFISPDAATDRYSYEIIEQVRQLDEIPKWMQILHSQVIIPISKIINNPIEKGANLYANQQENNKEKALEKKVEEVEQPASILHADFALTVETRKVWEDPYRSQQLYVGDSTYSLLKRWEEVHEADDTYIFPKESIKDRDWDKVAEVAEEFNSNLERDVSGYIFGKHSKEDVDVENLVEEAQQDKE